MQVVRVADVKYDGTARVSLRTEQAHRDRERRAVREKRRETDREQNGEGPRGEGDERTLMMKKRRMLLLLLLVVVVEFQTHAFS